MHKQKNKIIKTLKTFLFVLFILVILVSCNKERARLIKNKDNEIIYRVQNDNFIFKDINMDEKRAKQIIDNCIETFNKIKNEKNTYNDVDIIFSNSEDFNISNNKIEIPYTTLNDNISFEELYITGKMYKASVSKWENFGYTRLLLKGIGFLESEIIIKDIDAYNYIEKNLQTKPYELLDKNFSIFGDDFLVNYELSENYAKFLSEKHGKDEILNNLKNDKKSKQEWLEKIGFKVSLKDNEYVFLLDNKDLNGSYQDFDKKIIINNTEYYFSTKYTTEKQAEVFIEFYYDYIEKIRKYFQDNEFTLPNRNIKFKIISDEKQKKLHESSIYIDTTSMKNNEYISEYTDNYIASPVTSWLRHGMQSLLESKYNPNYDSLNKDKLGEKEILQNKDNHYLLAFDNDYFKVGKIITEQSEKAYTLAKSFVGFLEKHLGSKKLVELYTNEYDFEKITKSTEKDLKILWVESLNLDKKIVEGLKNPEIEDLNTLEIKEKFSFEFGYIFYESDNAKYYFEKNYMTYNDMWDFIQLAEEGILNIKSYLGFHYEKTDEKIEYFLRSGEGSSFSAGNRTNLYYVKDKKAEYVHETVHLLTGYDTSLWISEGLATYLDVLFTKWITPPTYGQNIDVLASEILLSGNKEGLLKFDDYFFTQESGTFEHMQSYILASSFIKYIENTYGRKSLLLIYDDISNVEIITSKNLEEIKKDWVLSYDK